MIKEYSLDTRASTFIKEVLAGGKYFAQKVTEEIEKSDLKIDSRTFISREASEAQLYRFDVGGVTSATAAKEKLIKLVREISDENSFLVIEDPLSKASDPYVKKSDQNYFTIQEADDVYWFVIGDELRDEDKLSTILRYANKYPFLAFWGKAEEMNKIRKGKVPKSLIDSLSSYVEILVVGAYDEEGYLVAELKKSY